MTRDARFDGADDPFGEKPLARRRRLRDRGKEGKKALEVDRSGSSAHLEKAAKRLRAAHVEDRILRAPQKDLAKAVIAMQRAGVSGVVTNLSGSVVVRVRPHKGPAKGGAR